MDKLTIEIPTDDLATVLMAAIDEADKAKLVLEVFGQNAELAARLERLEQAIDSLVRASLVALVNEIDQNPRD